MSGSLKVREGRARCLNVVRLCQGDIMKKGISLELAVMPTVPLMVTVVMASIIPSTKKI
jgi:hypothetical protein